MRALDKQRIQRQLASPQFAGKPTYFFDMSYLLANVATLADWNEARLDAAIAPRVETAISTEDARFSSDKGFYVVFASPDNCVAWDIAKAIRDDILRHFYGNGNYSPEAVSCLCRQ